MVASFSLQLRMFDVPFKHADVCQQNVGISRNMMPKLLGDYGKNASKLNMEMTPRWEPHVPRAFCQAPQEGRRKTALRMKV